MGQFYLTFLSSYRQAGGADIPFWVLAGERRGNKEGRTVCTIKPIEIKNPTLGFQRENVQFVGSSDERFTRGAGTILVAMDSAASQPASSTVTSFCTHQEEPLVWGEKPRDEDRWKGFPLLGARTSGGGYGKQNSNYDATLWDRMIEHYAWLSRSGVFWLH